jgi:hypothetical protein
VDEQQDKAVYRVQQGFSRSMRRLRRLVRRTKRLAFYQSLRTASNHVDLESASLAPGVECEAEPQKHLQ